MPKCLTTLRAVLRSSRGTVIGSFAKCPVVETVALDPGCLGFKPCSASRKLCVPLGKLFYLSVLGHLPCKARPTQRYPRHRVLV